MEKQPGTNNRVQITKAVFDGLEFIRSSGATNMLDRPMVLNLAREWNFEETADWIESVDTATYGRLILQGPEVVDNDSSNEIVEHDASHQAIEIDQLNQAMVDERENWHDFIIHLGKQASLTIADTYEVDQMGVLFDPLRRTHINAERIALMKNLAEASSLGLQLEEMMTEIQRGIEALQHMIDPENN